MKVSEQSWHYKLQDFFDLDPWQRTDICSYWRGILLALINSIGIVFALLVLALAFFLGTALISLAISHFILGMNVVSTGFLFIGIVAVIYKNIKTKDNEAEPSILYKKYISWKDRVCYNVGFK